MEVIERIFSLHPLIIAGLLLAVVVFVFLPGIVAVVRRDKDKYVILGTNLVFFWSFAVWAALMVWAFTGKADQSLLERLSRSPNGRTVALVTGGILIVGLGAAMFLELPAILGG